MSDCSLISCPICQKKLYAKADICPHCGFQIKKHLRKKAIGESFKKFCKRTFEVASDCWDSIKDFFENSPITPYLIGGLAFIVGGPIIILLFALLKIIFEWLNEDCGVVGKAVSAILILIAGISGILYLGWTARDRHILFKILFYPVLAFALFGFIYFFGYEYFCIIF